MVFRSLKDLVNILVREGAGEIWLVGSGATDLKSARDIDLLIEWEVDYSTLKRYDPSKIIVRGVPKLVDISTVPFGEDIFSYWDANFNSSGKEEYRVLHRAEAR